MRLGESAARASDIGVRKPADDVERKGLRELDVSRENAKGWRVPAHSQPLAR